MQYSGWTKASHLTEVIRFFLYDTPKVFILLTVIVFVVGIIRSYFSPEKRERLWRENLCLPAT